MLQDLPKLNNHRCTFMYLQADNFRAVEEARWHPQQQLLLSHANANSSLLDCCVRPPRSPRTTQPQAKHNTPSHHPLRSPVLASLAHIGSHCRILHLTPWPYANRIAEKVSQARPARPPAFPPGRLSKYGIKGIGDLYQGGKIAVKSIHR